MIENPRILVVDDRPQFLQTVRASLEGSRYLVEAVTDPEQAIEQCRQQRFHLAVIDVRLADSSGLDLVPPLRDLNPQMGFMLITAYADTRDAVRAMRDLGVLDYVEKPSLCEDIEGCIEETLARMEQGCQIGAHEQLAPADGTQIKLGNLIIHPAARRVERNGQTPLLTRHEFNMLLYLACHQGRTVPYEELWAQVWQEEPSPYFHEAIRNAMSRLRKKLDDPPDGPVYIHTVRGVGYQAEG